MLRTVLGSGDMMEISFPALMKLIPGKRQFEKNDACNFFFSISALTEESKEQ